MLFNLLFWFRFWGDGTRSHTLVYQAVSLAENFDPLKVRLFDTKGVPTSGLGRMNVENIKNLSLGTMQIDDEMYWSTEPATPLPDEYVFGKSDVPQQELNRRVQAFAYVSQYHAEGSIRDSNERFYSKVVKEARKYGVHVVPVLTNCGIVERQECLQRFAEYMHISQPDIVSLESSSINDIPFPAEMERDSQMRIDTKVYLPAGQIKKLFSALQNYAYKHQKAVLCKENILPNKYC